MQSPHLFSQWLCAVSVLVISPAIVGAQAPRVAGFNELVILDPGTNPEGLPAVKFRPSADGSKMEIDIPPTVHVHRFYYSGNKEYQGPILVGGPTVVVANNPWNGERMYIDVMLPGGAPIICYEKCGITYVFPDRRVCITFPFLCREKAVVTYASGRGVERCVHEVADKLKAKTAKAAQESKLVGTLKKAAHETKEVATGAAMAVGAGVNVALETTQKLVNMVPGYQTLQSLGKQLPERAFQESQRQAETRQAAEALILTPTNR